MKAPKEVPFEVKDQPPLVVTVTLPDGQKYDVLMAVMVHDVIEQGVTNPLDGMPILQIAHQVVMKVKRHEDQ